jgi:uridine phosphorylase
MPPSVATDPIHLRPNAPVAERALLPGDPGRALRLAQHLLAAPMQVLNTHRGLWGYTGTAADGAPLTIQSTGMGGPSAAIVAEELIGLGARRLVRAGTCGALVPGLRLGELLAVEAALCEDGASRALGCAGRVEPDPALLAALPGRRAIVASADLFYDPDEARAARWAEAGAVAVEMESAALFAVARHREAAAASVLAVSDLLADGGRERIGDDVLASAELELGAAALAALGSGGNAPPPPRVP